MDDLRAVMDEVGSEQAVVFGTSEGAAMSALFAATYPQRTLGLILYGAYAYRPLKRENVRRFIEEIRWGTQEFADQDLQRLAPSVASEPELRRWAPSWIRFSATPPAFMSLMRMRADTDVRHVLPAIRVTTLVLHRSGDRLIPPKLGRELAELIVSASYVELPGVDHYPWFGETEPLFAEIEHFVAGLAAEAAFDRVLTTLLFTDIVQSTERAASVGDRAWSKLVADHHALVRAHLVRFRGREIDTAGDGFLASFDGPARAIRCACALTRAVRELGLDVRAGVHTGECELAGDKFRGIAVHVGVRIAAQATAGEVLVSGTVKDLVAGAGITFEPRGKKGAQRPRRVASVRGGSGKRTHSNPDG
jgi:class 3 adenylate cyclase